jgi:heme-degrading monooxygenase HmoA
MICTDMVQIIHTRRITLISLLVRNTVADYAIFRSVFDSHEVFRRANGAIGVVQVYRDVENPNHVTTIVEWDSLENVRKFASSPELKEAMHAAGVISAPEVHFLNRA